MSSNKNTITVAVQSAATVLTVGGKSEGLAELLNKSAAGSAPAISAAGLAEPDKSAPKGLADPSKTAQNSKGLADPSKPAEGSKRPQSIPVRRHVRVAMGGAWVDVDGVLNPRRSPVNNPSDPPKNKIKIGEKSGKGCNDPIQIHNRFAPQDDANMEVKASRLATPRSRSGSPPSGKA